MYIMYMYYSTLCNFLEHSTDTAFDSQEHIWKIVQ